MRSDANEALCQKIVAAVSNGFFISDRTGVIVLWKGGAEAIFGYRAEEAVGRPPGIIPEQMYKHHWNGYYSVMETGESRYGHPLLKVPAMSKDGQRIALEFSVALIQDGHGTVAGAAAMVRDVTAHRQKERMLRARLDRLETDPPARAPPS